MTTLVVRGPARISGTVAVPGDKSLSHRALVLAAAAHGTSTITGLGPGGDVASTRRCLSAYGVRIRDAGDAVEVEGAGVDAWREPPGPLDCGNSGTTMRILAGLAARCGFTSVLDGDDSLRRRPMDRIAVPLRRLGARVDLRDGSLPPIRVSGGGLTGAEVEITVASAQVKSAVLLAGLGASGTTAVVEPGPSRDHTERMLSALGAPIRVTPLPGGRNRIEVEAFEPRGFSLDVPGDPSSAAFLLAAALLRGEMVCEGVGLNPTRTGFLGTVSRMNGRVESDVTAERMGEPVGRVSARRSDLVAVELGGDEVPAQVDEIPLVAVLATQARGTTVVSGASELRVKESDRVEATVDGLRGLGARIQARPDGFVVTGPTPLRGAKVDARGDHRIAMAMAVAGLAASGETRVAGHEAAAVSWPGFEEALRALGADVEVEA